MLVLGFPWKLEKAQALKSDRVGSIPHFTARCLFVFLDPERLSQRVPGILENEPQFG